MKIIYYLAISFFLIGCTKEKIVKEFRPVDYRWKPHLTFIYDDATVLNSFTFNNNLYFIGNSFVVFSDSGKKVVNYVSQGEFNINYKLPINSIFYIDFSEVSSYIGIHGIAPLAMNNGRGIWINEIDTSFSYFAFPGYKNGECMKINNQNQILIPYHAKYSKVSIMLVNMKLDNEGSDYWIGDTLKTRILRFSNERSVYNLFSSKDYFIVSMDSTYKIKANGDASKVVNDNLWKVFQRNDTLYGISYNKIYRSIDNGDNWAIISEKSSDLVRLNYYIINNAIIATYYAQLFHIAINNDSFTIKEIDNDGLVNNYITSVSNYSDKIYVTTLTGVFYIDNKDFFTYKTTTNK
jgi:hypothetical protein